MELENWIYLVIPVDAFLVYFFFTSYLDFSFLVQIRVRFKLNHICEPIKMRIVVVGSLYGQLDQVYRETRALEKQHGLIDLVVVCGNFQAFRNPNDLANVSAPAKYKKLGDFHDYFTGKKQASHLTLVVGGNYEASSYFQALPYGGWIAPDIFFMGYSNVIKFNGVRIAAVSGMSHQHPNNLDCSLLNRQSR